MGSVSYLAAQGMWARLGHLCVLDDQMPRRQDQGDQGCGEQHLDDGNIAIVAAEDLGEGIGMVYSEALGRP